MVVPMRFFLFCYILYLSLGLLLSLLFSQNDITLWFNAHHTPFADLFFGYFTDGGDGLFYLFIAFLACWWLSWRDSGFFIGIFVLQAVLVQGLKKVFFADVMRPAAVLGKQHVLHFADGVPIFYKHSFPSGHTATAFALATLLALFWQKYCQSKAMEGNPVRYFWQLFVYFALFLYAVGVGISRVYLLQHFLIDTLVGSLIGCLVAWTGFGLMSEGRWKKASSSI